MSMTTVEKEREFYDWCARNQRDPELGQTAREYEESLSGGPIEEWWDEMDADAEERRYWDTDPRR
jgi:hypothetical protein